MSKVDGCEVQTPRTVRKNLERSPQKVSFQRLELAIRRFTESAIPLHLELLKKHKDNIEKYQKQGNWEYVNKEQINARRTVQQLKSALLEMDKVERQVFDQDLPTFLKRVDPVRNTTIAALEDFLSMKVSSPTVLPEVTKRIDHSHVTNYSSSSSNQFAENSVAESGDGTYRFEDMVQIQAEKPEDDAKVKAAAETSKVHLMNDLMDLNQMIHRFYNLVQEQQAPIDRIEDSLETAHENIGEGTKHLGMAAKLKSSLVPLTGALLGGCVAGPIGMMAGFKIGGGIVAVVGGGLIGYQGARYLRHRKNTAVDEDLMLLSGGRRHEFMSLPDLNSPDDLQQGSNYGVPRET